MNKTSHPINSSEAQNHHIINKTCYIQATRRKNQSKAGRTIANRKPANKQHTTIIKMSTILPKNGGVPIIKALDELT